MLFKYVFSVIGLAAVAMSTASAQSGPTVLEMEASGEVQIARDGHVSDYRLNDGGNLPPAVATLIDRSMRGWQFEPVVVDGAAVVAKTAMHLALKAEPLAAKDSYKVTITHIQFGDPKPYARLQPPRYPEDAAHARLGARVLLSVRIDGDGKVIDTAPYQTSLSARARGENEAEHWRRMFERASVAAVKNWRFNVTEKINGNPIGTTVLVPIDYNMASGFPPKPQRNQWVAYVPGPIHPAPWNQKAARAPDERSTDALADGQPLSLDSHFKLRSDVIGKAL